MTYEEAQLTLLLLSELGHGGPNRLEAYRRKAVEDSAAAGLARATEERTR